MESIFKKVNKLLKEYPEDDLADLMVELERNEPTLDERLAEAHYTRTEALAAAHAEPIRRAELAKKIGIENLDFPYLWAELSEKCIKISREKLDLILWLMADGKLTVPEGLSDEELISGWLHSTCRVKEYGDFLDNYIKALEKFTDIELALENSKLRHPEGFINSADSERVFALLCNCGYADDYGDLKILKGNLKIVSGIIGELSFLEPVKPLIYFQICVRYRKKLFESCSFIPNKKKILEFREYDITNDNGKNFNQYYTYCHLYSELKKCFPNADHELCDAGFTSCSNLPVWWYMIGTMDYERVLDLDIPFTPEAFVLEGCVTCFEDNALDRFIGFSAKETITFRKSYPIFCTNARKAVQEIKFSELRDFADNTAEFCVKRFDQGQLEGDKRVDHDIAWALFVSEVKERFDELLEDELLTIIERWVLLNIGQ